MYNSTSHKVSKLCNKLVEEILINRKTIGRDCIKIANCIFKMQLLPIKEEIP